MKRRVFLLSVALLSLAPAGAGAGAADRAEDRTDRARPTVSQSRPQQSDRPASVRSDGRQGCAAAAGPGAGAVVEGRRRHGVGVQAAARCDVQRRLALHRRGRRLHLRSRGQGPEQPLALHPDHAAGDQARDRRSAHPAHLDRLARAAAAARPLRPADPVAHRRRRRRARRQDDGGAQSRRGVGRHRAVQVRRLEARQRIGAGAQRRLLGTEACVGRR